MNRTEILEALQAATPADKILLLSLLTYKQIPITDDLLDNDVPAWKNVEDIADTIPPVPFPLDVIATGTAIPYFIDAALYSDFNQYSEIVTKTKSGDNYVRRVDMEVTEVFSGSDFTGWNVQLITNDNAVSSEDVYIVLKA